VYDTRTDMLESYKTYINYIVNTVFSVQCFCHFVQRELGRRNCGIFEGRGGLSCGTLCYMAVGVLTPAYLLLPVQRVP
jgi:hypothetical protein